MENTKQKKKKSEILNNQRRYDLRSNSVAKHKRDRYIFASQASDSLNSSIGWKELSTFSHDNERKKYLLFAKYLEGIDYEVRVCY